LLVVWRKMDDYHNAAWSPLCRIFRASALIFPSLFVPAAGNRYTELFITESQIRFPFVRDTEMTVEVIRTYQDVVVEIERYFQYGTKGRREQALLCLRASCSKDSKEKIVSSFLPRFGTMLYTARKIFIKFAVRWGMELNRRFTSEYRTSVVLIFFNKTSSCLRSALSHFFTWFLLLCLLVMELPE